MPKYDSGSFHFPLSDELVVELPALGNGSVPNKWLRNSDPHTFRFIFCESQAVKNELKPVQD